MLFSKDSTSAKILILGTYHFGSAGEHTVNTNIADVLSDKKQQEILDLVQRLERFKPNKIAVEAPVSSCEALNKTYHKYCSDSHILDRNEIHQLGFRLARMLDHPKIYPVDFPSSIPDEPVHEYIQANIPEMYDQFHREVAEYVNTFNQLQQSGTVSDSFKFLNNPERFSSEHSDWYLKFAQIGAGETYIGADLLLAWYNRNIRIFANLQKLAEPGDRILLIYGAGHLKILSELVSGYSCMELVEAGEYL